MSCASIIPSAQHNSTHPSPAQQTPVVSTFAKGGGSNLSSSLIPKRRQLARLLLLLLQMVLVRFPPAAARALVLPGVAAWLAGSETCLVVMAVLCDR